MTAFPKNERLAAYSPALKNRGEGMHSAEAKGNLAFQKKVVTLHYSFSCHQGVVSFVADKKVVCRVSLQWRVACDFKTFFCKRTPIYKYIV